MELFTNKLSKQIYLLIFLGMALILCIFFLYEVTRAKISLTSHTEEDAVTLSSLVGGRIAGKVASRDFGGLREETRWIVSNINKEDGLKALKVTILDNEMAVLAGTGPGGQPLMKTPGKASGPLATGLQWIGGGGDRLRVIAAVRDHDSVEGGGGGDGKGIGCLIIDYDTSFISKELFELRTNLILLLISSFLLSLIFAITIGRKIEEPLTSLSRLTEKIGDGKMDISHLENRQDEISTLAAALKRADSSIASMAGQLKESCLKAEKASEAKSNFLATMCHEIRTPMNAVMGLSDLLSCSKLDDEQSDYVSTISIAGKNLLGIVNDILDISKIEASCLKLENDAVNLHNLLERTRSIFFNEASSKGVDIDYTIQKGTPRLIEGDSHRLTQILTNLISNGLKFTDKGGVHIELKPLGGDSNLLLFTVRDTGIGIKKDRICHIFENYIQGDLSTSRLYGGTGLGLGISKGLVEVMGGRIWVESTAGKGSSFHFTITGKPYKKTRAVEMPPEEPSKDSFMKDLGGLKVLLIEDDIINRKVMAKILEKMNCTVTTASSGYGALMHFNCGLQFDVILMDISLPDTDGYRLTKKIRRSEESTNLHIPIIATTAYAFKEDVDRCFNAGMDDYISKPVTRERLNTILYRYR